MKIDFRELSLNDLITRLHQTIIGFIEGMESVLEMNKSYGETDITELRDHVSERLKKGEEVADNQKVIGLLDLLSRDQAVLKLVKKDAEEWVDMLDAIEENIKARGPLSASEKAEIKQIDSLTSDLRKLIRK